MLLSASRVTHARTSPSSARSTRARARIYGRRTETPNTEKPPAARARARVSSYCCTVCRSISIYVSTSRARRQARQTALACLGRVACEPRAKRPKATTTTTNRVGDMRCVRCASCEPWHLVPARPERARRSRPPTRPHTHAGRSERTDQWPPERDVVVRRVCVHIRAWHGSVGCGTNQQRASGQ